MDDDDVKPTLRAMWKFMLETDANQKKRDRQTYEQEVELRASRYMLEFYKVEIKELRKGNENALRALEEANKRQKMDTGEKTDLLRTMDKKDKEIEELREQLIKTVRQRDKADYEVSELQKKLLAHDSRRKSFRSSVSMLRNSLDGHVNQEVLTNLGYILEYVKN